MTHCCSVCNKKVIAERKAADHDALSDTQTPDVAGKDTTDGDDDDTQKSRCASSVCDGPLCDEELNENKTKLCCPVTSCQRFSHLGCNKKLALSNSKANLTSNTYDTLIEGLGNEVIPCPEHMGTLGFVMKCVQKGCIDSGKKADLRCPTCALPFHYDCMKSVVNLAHLHTLHADALSFSLSSLIRIIFLIVFVSLSLSLSLSL